MITMWIVLALALGQGTSPKEKSLSEWIGEFKTTSEQDRKLEIVAAIARMGRDGAGFLEMVGMGPPSPIRDRAIVLLGDMMPPALEPLGRIALNGPKGARIAALTTLANLGEASIPLVTKLIPLLEHSEPQTRLYAIRMLGNCGPRGYQAIPALLEVLRFGDKEEYPAAHHALLKMSKSAFTFSMDIVPGMMRNYLKEVGDSKAGLAELAKSKSPSLRREAIRQVVLLGQEGKSALPVLQNLLQDKDPSVSQEAFDAIQKLK